jgi:uncharacterized protein (DUF433 family)/predicted transcriptional regulator
MEEHIVRDGDTGRAIVSSTGTPVDEILQTLESSGPFESVLRRHPELTPEAVAAALRFARVAVARGGRSRPDPGPGFTGVRERPVETFNAGSSAGATVTLDVGEYNDLLSRLDLLEGILEAEGELDAGEGIPHEQVFAAARAGVQPASQAESGTVEDALRSAAEKREQLLYELDIIESIHAGLEDVIAGRVISHEEVMARLHARFPG